MKNISWLLFLFLLIGCKLNSTPVEYSSTEEHSADPEKAIHNVFAKYHGPEAATRRFQKFLEVAADDHGLKLIADRSRAEALVNVTVEEETAQHPVYGELLTVKFSLRDGKSYLDESCESTSSSPFKRPLAVTVFLPLHLGSFARNLKNHDPSISKLFVPPIANDSDLELTRAINASLILAGYTLVPAREQADASLESADLHYEEIPARVLQQHLTVKASVASWPKYSFSSNTTRYSYQSIGKLPTRAQACAESAKHYLNNTDNNDPFWGAARELTRSLAHNTQSN